MRNFALDDTLVLRGEKLARGKFLCIITGRSDVLLAWPRVRNAFTEVKSDLRPKVGQGRTGGWLLRRTADTKQESGQRKKQYSFHKQNTESSRSKKPP